MGGILKDVSADGCIAIVTDLMRMKPNDQRITIQALCQVAVLDVGTEEAADDIASVLYFCVEMLMAYEQGRTEDVPPQEA